MKATPIFINAKNRVSFLSQLIERFLADGFRNIHIVDSGSTYPPMLEYYKRISFACHCCNPQVLGHLALWNCGILVACGKSGAPYVYTDCDVLPDENCPSDWLEHLFALLEKYPQYPKAGLGLRIDNLPDCYARKQEVIHWESQFWTAPLEPDVYSAPIDTTLACYRTGAMGLSHAIRTGGKYVARHLPWYADSAQPTEEDAYYKAHMCGATGHWR